MRHIESRIQQECVRWFRLQHPNLYWYFFAVPNGGWRSGLEAKIMKGEGVVSGVSDLLFLFPNGVYHGLCIEMKSGEKGSKQSDNQIEFQKAMRAVGYKYVVCNSFDSFKQEIEIYLNGM